MDRRSFVRILAPCLLSFAPLPAFASHAKKSAKFSTKPEKAFQHQRIGFGWGNNTSLVPALLNLADGRVDVWTVWGHRRIDTWDDIVVQFERKKEFHVVAAALPSEVPLVLCVKAVPHQSSNSSKATKNAKIWSEIASGRYDTYIMRLGASLENLRKRYNRKTIVMRLAWEFTGNWYPWSVGRDIDGFVNGWSRFASILKNSVKDGKISWDPAARFRDVPSKNLDDFWPYNGQSVVDHIGINWHNNNARPGASGRELTEMYYKEHIAQKMAFARAKRKIVVTNELSYYWKEDKVRPNKNWGRSYVGNPRDTLQSIVDMYRRESQNGTNIAWVSWHINGRTAPFVDKSVEQAFRMFVRELRNQTAS